MPGPSRGLISKSVSVRPIGNTFYSKRNNKLEVLGFLGSSITYATAGYRKMTMDHLDSIQSPDPTYVNISSNGYTSWTNLILLDTVIASNPKLIVMDAINDDTTTFRKATCEALIRRIRTTLPTCRIVMMKFFVVSNINDDATVNTPNTTSMFAQWDALGTLYTIPIVPYWETIRDLVAGGTHLNTYMADVVHPLPAGHLVASNLLKPYLFNSIHNPTIPTRLYPTSVDYEYTPQVIPGTSYTSRTGTWTTVGNQISSNEVGATVTYTSMCRSFGIYRADSLDSPTYYSIDGAADVGMNSYPPYGWPCNSRASHTLRFKVISGTLKIDAVWTI